MERRKFIVNGIDLNDGVMFRIKDTNLFGTADVVVDYADFARSDGRTFLGDRMAGRTIEFAGQIATKSQAEADTAIDILKRLLRYGVTTVVVDFPDGDRMWRGEVSNINISRGAQDISRAAFSFQLMTETPAAEATGGAVPLVEPTTITNSSALLSGDNVGTYIAQPLITIQTLSVSNGAEFIIGNPDTSEYTTFTLPFKSGDIITIDCQRKSIVHNGSIIRGAGTFPAWLPGKGLIEYNDNINTSRQVKLTATYTPRYL